MGTIIKIPKEEKFYKHKKIDCAHCPVGHFCCTLKVKLSLFDRMKIFFATGMRTKKYADRLFDNSGWGIKLVNQKCFFLQKEGKKAYCKIYRARPKICKQFPHFHEEINDCRDIVSVWKPKIIDSQHKKSI